MRVPAAAAAAPPARPRSPGGRARAAAAALRERYPEACCALRHRTPLELLVATILSAQSTDRRVNEVTPALFARLPTAAAYAAVAPEELEEVIHSTGFFRAKARSLIGMGRVLVERFGGEVPADLEALTSLPGVGRKTANVVLGVAFGIPGFPVDTHVTRLVGLLGISRQHDPVKIEAEVCRLLPASGWTDFSLRLIEHGRQVCIANRPRCADCSMAGWCPGARRLAGPARAVSGR